VARARSGLRAERRAGALSDLPREA
jgi:hypothetical protein